MHYRHLKATTWISLGGQGRSDGGGDISVYIPPTPKWVTVFFTCGTLTVLKLQWLVKTYTPQIKLLATPLLVATPAPNYLLLHFSSDSDNCLAKWSRHHNFDLVNVDCSGWSERVEQYLCSCTVKVSTCTSNISHIVFVCVHVFLCVCGE